MQFKSLIEHEVWSTTMIRRASEKCASVYSRGYFRLRQTMFGFGYHKLLVIERVCLNPEETKIITLKVYLNCGEEPFPHPNGEFFALQDFDSFIFYDMEGRELARNKLPTIYDYRGERTLVYLTYLHGNRYMITNKKAWSVVYENFEPLGMIYHFANDSGFKYERGQVLATDEDIYFPPDPMQLPILGCKLSSLLKFTLKSYRLPDPSPDDHSSNDRREERDRDGQDERGLVDLIGECRIISTEFKGISYTEIVPMLEKSPNCQLADSISSEAQSCLLEDYQYFFQKARSIFKEGSDPLFRRNDRYIVSRSYHKISKEDILTVMDRRTRRLYRRTVKRYNIPPLVIMRGQSIVYRITTNIYSPRFHSECETEIMAFEPHTLWSPSTHHLFIPRYQREFFLIFCYFYLYTEIPVELLSWILEEADRLHSEELDP